MMKIDAYSAINPVQAANKVAKTTVASKPVATDKVEISQAGRDFQIAKKAVSEAPDVRQDKIDSIKARLADGTYEVSDEALADKMLAAMFR